MAAGEHNPDRSTPRRGRRDARAPVAALLFDPAMVPHVSDVVALADAGGAFAVTHRDPVAGHAELLCDGLAFDCHGLMPGDVLFMETPLHRMALPADFAVGEMALVTLSPGANLAGAGPLLPVVRMLGGLIMALGGLPGLRAVAWLPARQAMSPAWFAEAVGIWLNGGPFPALALTALVRSQTMLSSQGLAYFVGQEFAFSGKDGILRENDARGAVRLTDWLVAHGRVDSPCEIDLPGFGTVQIEPDGQNRLRARSL